MFGGPIFIQNIARNLQDSWVYYIAAYVHLLYCSVPAHVSVISQWAHQQLAGAALKLSCAVDR